MFSMSRPSSTSLVLSALAGVSIASYFYYRHQSRRPRRTLQDLRGNFYATGSDVCRLYQHRIPGMVVVITGTSSGLGAHTAQLLGRHGAWVIMGNRRPEDATALTREIERAGGKALSLFLDLASLASVRAFADRVQTTLQGQGNGRIHVLIHNAGVTFLDGATQDGFQRVWQVNALAPALLTELLLPRLCPENGRVLWVSSEMHRLCFGNRIVDQCPPNKNGGRSATDYALSKACQILQARECNDRPKGDNIRGIAVEPGLVRTEIGRHAPRLLLEVEYVLLGPFFLRTVDQGCSSILFCAVAPLADLDDGHRTDEPLPFYFANCLAKRPKANCTNLQEAQRMQRLCRDLWKHHLQ